jgi:energy-coupling factor transport system substrate-specific component
LFNQIPYILATKGKFRMFTTPRLVVIALCAALNIAIGAIVYLVKLPIYLDSIGTILCALLLAPDRKAAFLCAWTASWIGMMVIGVINPYFPWFALTQITIAAVSAFVTLSAADIFRTRPMPRFAFSAWVVGAGLVTGVAAAIVSAPVVVYLFGGVTGSGTAFVVAFFLSAGRQLMSATLLAGLTAEPIDKVLQVLAAALLYRATPRDLIALLRDKAAEVSP